MEELRFDKAINRALTECLEQDPSVILMGEDVGEAGGVFGLTRGLQQRFGERRVRDTPISEAALVGAAVGAALSGLRPIVEIMFMDFITLAMDAIVNQAAKAHYMFGGRSSVPLVIRTPHGGGLSAGPQHSQCLEAWFAHVPGLKVLVPSTPADAYTLLKAAVADPDPVIFVEHKALYKTKQRVQDLQRQDPLGAASVRRQGSDVTLVAYGAAVNLALEAAEDSASIGIEAEVIDLRGVQPWDERAVVASVKKTGRLVVVHEAVTAFGVGAEVAARVAQVAFPHLRAPIVRVGSRFTPVPYAPGLEAKYAPGKIEVLSAIEEVTQYVHS